MKLSKWMLKYQKANDYPDLVLSQDWALRAAKLESRIVELEASEAAAVLRMKQAEDAMARMIYVDE